jgi:hypothetical protein
MVLVFFNEGSQKVFLMDGFGARWSNSSQSIECYGFPSGRTVVGSFVLGSCGGFAGIAALRFEQGSAFEEGQHHITEFTHEGSHNNLV